jgi:hypothetical protein
MLVMAAVIAACEASVTPSEPSPRPSPSVAVEPSVTPSADPSPSATPQPSPTPSPTPVVVTWPRNQITVHTSAGGADIALSGRRVSQGIHVVVSNLEEALPGFRDASVYARSDDGGKSWREKTMLEGTPPSIASVGRHVYLAHLAYACGDGIGVQRSDDRGAKGSWSPVQCLTRDGDGISWSSPAIEAWGRHVYVSAYEDPRHIASVWVSHDFGRTWLRTRLRTLRQPVPDSDSPSNVRVAVHGPRAVVTWDVGATTFARVSTDHGRNWSPRVRLGDGRVISVAAGPSRLAVAGTSRDTAPWLHVWSDGQWTQVAVPDPQPREEMNYPAYQVALRGAHDIGLLYASCGEGPPNATIWVTSADDGATWAAPERVKGCFAFGSTVIWTEGGDVVILSEGGGGYVLRIRP